MKLDIVNVLDGKCVIGHIIDLISKWLIGDE
jgi:hypothetical protein